MKRTALLIGLLTLNACTPYAESFDCTPGRGVGCKSLSQVNQMVEDGKLPLEEVSSHSREGSLIEAKRPLNLIPTDSTNHLKVWIAGYEESGEEDMRFTHMPSVVYVSLKTHEAP